MKSKGGESEERADDPKSGRGQDEDEKIVHKRNGCKGSGDKGTDVMVGAKASDDEGDHCDEEDERGNSIAIIGKEEGS